MTAGEREKDENGEYKKKDKNRSREVGIKEKESYLWIERGIAAKGRLTGVGRVTVVQDREGSRFRDTVHPPPEDSRRGR